ncbi:serine protease [Microvirga sp. ACRRW]|uniref:S1 family peptidase n=1 Tax=Microvirga sp. ACRRW TaxID=2918205 RepID=UPI001EF5C097|nr:serine protease [Microvirga sp. ACRRW]MCG7394350.1 serine protease [Microvirga sp. ACRRW]
MSNPSEQYVRDVIVPIAEVELQHDELAYKRLCGTGFVIGRSKYLLTAAHVLENVEFAVGMKTKEGNWFSIEIEIAAQHPSEDIVICAIKDDQFFESWLRLDGNHYHQACEYHIFGYPDDVLYEADQRGIDGRILQRPDLIYTKGYIRRRFSSKLPGLRGQSFFELSDPAGAGCSGAPLVMGFDTPWRVAGIYVGERTTEQAGRALRERGYALRIEAVTDWLRAIDPILLE